MTSQIKVLRIDRRFHGGIHPPENKAQSNHQAPRTLPLAKEFIMPLRQHIGQPCSPLVKVGDKVSRGQCIASSDIEPKAKIHAPVNGTIQAIEPAFCGHPSGEPELAIKIHCDTPDEIDNSLLPSDATNLTAQIIDGVDPVQALQSIEEAGIVGLGGATFPTHIKLSANGIDTLIINAMECEPFITCDDVLMRHYAKQIWLGALIVAKILDAKKVILATEDNKPEAIDAMQRAAETLSSPIELEIIVAPTRYPSGGEKQTIELVTGKQVPKGKLPASLGIVVQNVGTLFAVYEAVIEHKPLTRRLVTLTGDKVNQPGNYWLPFGTPIKHLLGLHLFNGDITQFVVGGPLMGTRYTNTDLPVQKNTNCLIFASRASQSHPWVIESKPHQACIRCGECEKVCPVNLLPQNLYWYARHDQWQQLHEYNLMDCIECGACAYVCPSEIPLVHYFRYGKSNLRLQARKKAKSDRAKARFEAKEARLAREKAERALKHQKAAEARRKAAQDAAQDPDGKKAAIQAALERVKAKKSNTTDHQSEDLS